MPQNICFSTPLSFFDVGQAGEKKQGASYPEHQSPCPQRAGPH